MRYFVLLFSTLLMACNTNKVDYPKVKHPKNNLPSKERIILGKMLFFEPKLSSNNQMSCAACHLPEKAFADNKKVSVSGAMDIVDRNIPTLMYVGFKPSLFAEGGVHNLEQQAAAPFLSNHELNIDLHKAAEILSEEKRYVNAFKKAFNSKPNALDITKALAVFQRSLVSFSSKYDAYLSGDLSALSINETAGMNLFMSEKLACSSCHSSPLFTNHQFEKTPIKTSDLGRYRYTENKDDEYKFMVPTLRNIALTAPYMHNGSVETLSEVIDLYTTDRNGNATLTELEKECLIAFLNALTDRNYFNKFNHDA